MRDVSHFIYDRSFIRDTLSYTSPEQTGRINHRVVFSSDLYSLGIVFYELLTGRLPFLSDDPLELIHSHLAEEAPAGPRAEPGRPGRPEQNRRQADAQGAGETLPEQQRPARRPRAVPGRVRGHRHDTRVPSGKLRLHATGSPSSPRWSAATRRPRSSWTNTNRSPEGQFRSLFISGLSGIGKTRLIQELQKPIVKHRGYFTSGKFDVYQKNIPYSSLIQALQKPDADLPDRERRTGRRSGKTGF